MKKRQQTKEEINLAERMRIALENEHNEKTPEPKIVSQLHNNKRWA